MYFFSQPALQDLMCSARWLDPHLVSVGEVRDTVDLCWLVAAESHMALPCFDFSDLLPPGCQDSVLFTESYKIQTQCY